MGSSSLIVSGFSLSLSLVFGIYLASSCVLISCATMISPMEVWKSLKFIEEEDEVVDIGIIKLLMHQVDSIYV